MTVSGQIRADQETARAAIFKDYSEPQSGTERKGLDLIVTGGFDPSCTNFDLLREVINTIRECCGSHDENTEFELTTGPGHPRVFSAELYLQSGADATQKPLAMTRTFEGKFFVTSFGRTGIEWYKITDQYHDPESARTVKVTTEFNPNSGAFKKFEFVGAEQDSLCVTVAESGGETVVDIKYKDRTGTIVTEIPPVLLEPIQKWAQEEGIPIASTTTAD